MKMKYTILFSVLSAVFTPIMAQEKEVTLPTVFVTANPLQTSEDLQILSPAKVLFGNELQNKLGTSLGDTLSGELGVSASSFGGNASRPIIRGLEGNRIKILENGMNISDISSLSNDHAVTSSTALTQQIEILRGPTTLLYGSGAIGGLVNVINPRILTQLPDQITGEAKAIYSTVNQGHTLVFALENNVDDFAFHIDGSTEYTNNYRIPGSRILNQSGPGGRLPWSFGDKDNIGIGASLIKDWGYVGLSIADEKNLYAIPTEDGAQIKLHNRRYDLASLLKNPFNNFSALRFKTSYTDYTHSELELTGTPEVNFASKTLESRLELDHLAIAGWRGTVGMQFERNQFSALSAESGEAETVPKTTSESIAAFIIEEKNIGDFTVNAGMRLEDVKRNPLGNIKRNFNLTSYSLGTLYPIAKGYSLGGSIAIAQRAPTTEELYIYGPHDASGTYDKGNQNFKKEKSRNIELNLQKNEGLLRWKGNLFYNQIDHFIYGELTGNQLDEEGDLGGDLNERIYKAGDAVIKGAEVEVSYNLNNQGFAWRAFSDTSRGRLNSQSNLPLQAATRFGAELYYKRNTLQGSINLIHALAQNNLASFESIKTPAYTKVDASLAYTQRYKNQNITWFILAKNILNEDIRLSTSLLKEFAPLPGRNFVVGVKSSF